MIRPPRTGFALLFTLVAIVLVSALVTATMFRVTENNYLAQLTTLNLHASAESEQRLWAMFSDPMLLTFTAAPIGAVKISTSSTGEVATVVTITKVDSATLWLVAAANAQRGRFTAAHRIGVSARLTRVLAPFAQPLPGPAWVDLY